MRTFSGGSLGPIPVIKETNGGDLVGSSSNIRFSTKGGNLLPTNVLQPVGDVTWTLLSTVEHIADTNQQTLDMDTPSVTTEYRNRKQASVTYIDGNLPDLTTIAKVNNGFEFSGNIVTQTNISSTNFTANIVTSRGTIISSSDVPVGIQQVISTGPAVPSIGSLRKHVTDNMTVAANSQIPSNNTKYRFSVQDHANVIYTPNPNCWAKDFDFSCESPWNSIGANTRAGTLVSPKHFIHANHFPITHGTTMRWVSAAGEVVTRTCVNSVQIGITDIRLGTLDSDITPNIKFAKILPDDWQSYIPTLVTNNYSSNPFPMFQLDQEAKILAAGIGTMGATTNITGTTISGILGTWQEIIIS